jgi:excisionase family DNA binding protein
MEKRFLSPKELSEYIGLAEQTIYHWVYEKKIPYHKIGRLIKFDIKEIDEFIAKLKVKPLKDK